MIAISQLNSFAKIRESFFDPIRSFAGWSATIEFSFLFLYFITII